MTRSVLIPKRVFKATLTGRRNESAGRVVACFGLAFFSFNFAGHLWNYWNATVPKMICVSATNLLVSLGSD